MMIWINGELRDAAAATVDASSAGLLLGWGVFTTVGVWEGRPFLLARHLARLRRDAGRMDVAVDFDDDTLGLAVCTVLRANEVRDGMARLTVTRRGDGRWNHAAGSDCTILAVPLSDPATRDTPLRLALSPYRLDARRPLVGLKSTSYLAHQWAWREAMAQGYDEAVLCNSTGAVCECARANLFWTYRGELYTPSLETGCLPGIAREVVLEWAAQLGWVARQGVFSPQELATAEEIFTTAATTGPRPVTAFYEGLPDGALFYATPGPVTQRLQEKWSAASRPV
jgi:branched-chain amino acid aminotransferase